MTNKNLSKTDVEHLFARLDAAAAQDKGPRLRLIVIGGAVLITEGMPDRATGDIDFWETTGEDFAALARLATQIGIAINPSHQEAPTPYFQWIKPDHVHMPLNPLWEDHCEQLWMGQHIDVLRPPIGVVLASKLALGRQQDIIDVRYIVQTHPNWKESLDVWKEHFSVADQEDIEDNLVFVDLYLRPSPKHGVNKSRNTRK